MLKGFLLPNCMLNNGGFVFSLCAPERLKSSSAVAVKEGAPGLLGASGNRRALSSQEPCVAYSSLPFNLVPGRTPIATSFTEDKHSKQGILRLECKSHLKVHIVLMGLGPWSQHLLSCAQPQGASGKQGGAWRGWSEAMGPRRQSKGTGEAVGKGPTPQEHSRVQGYRREASPRWVPEARSLWHVGWRGNMRFRMRRGAGKGFHTPVQVEVRKAVSFPYTEFIHFIGPALRP